ncbi:putative lipid-transfer protein DIR1 [Tripterygium wilfordii]|uniref:Putative lipid-transfer protein DIR1 n=1 Tax=Tripterygium wilfordii TaxID=458696 RepID=A0A7J7CIK9_TRIWF|nr:putative lipid-transfer protein DIR1 [Tripterygium wilfordii]
MEIKSQKILVVTVLMLLVTIGGGNGQTICNVTVSELMECRPAVTPPQPSPPTAKCCSVVSRVNMSCLCSYKNMLPSFNIDPNLVMLLPGKCKLPRPAKC